MRALLQRVAEARVTVADEVVGEIGPGLCVLVGVTHDDDEAAARKLAARVWGLRIFEDDDGVPNLSVGDAHDPAEVLVVSQFTLYGDTRKGRRPSWIAAARPEHAEPLIEIMIDELRQLGAQVATGRFRTDMQVSLTNDGPFTVTVEA